MKATLQMIDHELSMFNPSSTVSLVNTAGSKRRRSTSGAFSIYHKKSIGFRGGVYDPTIGPISNLWGFGPSETATEPDAEAISQALKAVGIDSCSIDTCGLIVRKSPATVFDFSSVAKGYGIDCVADTLEALGAHNYMIEIGGEVLACGLNPNGRRWRIQIDSPLSGLGHERLGVIELDLKGRQ